MINNVVLVGRITKDPELRKTNTGISTVTFTLAVNRKFKQDGQQEADFITCVAWRGSADFVCNYVKQGTLLGVEGRIQTRNYKDKNDKTVYVTEVVCESVQILAQKQGTQATNNTYQAPKAETQANTYAQPKSESYGTYGDAETEYGSDVLNIASDDLPF